MKGITFQKEYLPGNSKVLRRLLSRQFPLGYYNIPDNKKDLMINQHEANIVKYIFESYAKGHGYRKIANALNHKGYVTKERQFI